VGNPGRHPWHGLAVGAPAVATNVWLIGVVVILGVLGGLGGTMWGVMVVSIRQQVVPDELQGRVGGAIRLFGYGAMALLNLLLLIPFFTTVKDQAIAAARGTG
jgi:hypothetical protein